MLKRFLLASAMLFVPLTTFAQNATTQVNGANLNGNPVTILTPWVPNGDGTYSQKVASAGGGSGSNAAASPTGAPVPTSADYTGFNVSGNLVGVSVSNPLPVTGSFSATTTGTATTAAPTYVNNTSNPLSLNLAGGLRVDGSGATQPISGSISNTAFGISGTLPAFASPPAFKVSDTAGTGITSSTIAGKQRLDVTLAAGGVPGTAVSTIADQVGGVDGGGLLRALSVDTAGRVNVQGGNATAVKTDGSGVTQPVSGTVAVTGTFYQTTQPVSGSVGVSNFPATQAVSIATMPTTPVTGAFYQATQPVSGTVAVTGVYNTTAPVLTNGQYSAAQVDASGNLKVNIVTGGGSGSNAAASATGAAVPTSASYTGFNVGGSLVAVSAANPLPITGTISATTTANASAAAPTYTAGSNPLSVDLAGNLRVAGAVSISGTLPAFAATPTFNIGTAPTIAVTGGFYQTTQPVSGTVAVTGAYQATQPVSGTVAVTGAYQATQPVSIATMPSTPVTGTFYQATQPVSGTVAVTGAYQATQPVSIATMPSTPVTGTFYQATQPVSGTVAVTGAYQATQPVSIAVLPALTTGANVIGGVTQSGNWTVGGALLMPSATFTTTALTTAWTSNQLIANNATAGSVVPLTLANAVRVAGGTGSIRRAQIQVASDTGFAGQSLVLALYTVSPTFAAGDRATWLTSFSGFIGQIAVTLSQHFSDYEQGIGVPVNGSELNFACAGGSTTIYGVVVSAGTLTPQAASKAIIASLEILAN